MSGRVDMAVYMAFERLRFESPYDTGNLRFNSIKLERKTENEWRVFVNEDIAPYMVYTNEPWVNRKGKNPNEGWWDKASLNFVNNVKNYLGGVEE